MAITHTMYGSLFLSVFNKELDIDSDTLKLMLTTSAYTPDQDAHRYKSSVTNEITGTGYTAGGATLTTPVQAYTGATNVWNFDADDTVWSNATVTFRRGVLYDSTPGTDATRPLLSYIDFGADQSVTTANVTITWAAAGIEQVTVS